MDQFSLLLSLFLGTLLFSYLVAYYLKFPVIPVYILSGIAVSLFVHVGDVHFLETLGVVLLLFYIGLEFSLAEMERNLKNILSVGVVDLILNLFPVFFLLKFMGFKGISAFALAVALYPSSSAIVSKLLIDLKKLANPEVEPVLAILVFEDVAAATLLAVLVGLSNGSSSPVSVLEVAVKIVLFVFVSVVFIKNFNRVVDLAFRKVGTAVEFTVLLVGTLLFLLVEVSVGFGLSEAIGAFAAGTLFAESSYKEQVESVIIPYRDLFGALFFLTFGLTTDFSRISSPLVVTLLIILTFTFITKILTGVLSARLYGLSLKRGISAGFMLLPRGEFSILVGATDAGIVSLTALYVLLSSIIGSLAVKESGKILALFFKKKPRKKSRLTRSDLLED